jgi:hypothetical protein
VHLGVGLPLGNVTTDRQAAMDACVAAGAACALVAGRRGSPSVVWTPQVFWRAYRTAPQPVLVLDDVVVHHRLGGSCQPAPPPAPSPVPQPSPPPPPCERDRIPAYGCSTMQRMGRCTCDAAIDRNIARGCRVTCGCALPCPSNEAEELDPLHTPLPTPAPSPALETESWWFRLSWQHWLPTEEEDAARSGAVGAVAASAPSLVMVDDRL